MGMLKKCLLSFGALVLGSQLANAETLTIATVNNDDMIVMQKLSSEWEKSTGNKLNWVVLEENVLRQRVTTDIATKGGQFDIVTIGALETPIWGKSGWLTQLDDLGDDYDYSDLFPSVKNGLSADGKLFAVPFYAESSFTMYNTELFEKAGLKMPEQPTWTQIAEFAEKLTDKSKEQYGICLRGKPGWGENMALITLMANVWGGTWFDQNWQPQLTSEPWKKAVNFYVDTMNKYGPPGATANGFNENQALFAAGHCGIWVDATSAAGRLYNKDTSKVVDKVGYAKGPGEVTNVGNGWFWAWALAIPSSSTKAEVAKSFVKWATSKDYVKLVAKTGGAVTSPPGTRVSTYTEEYKKAAPFAEMTEKAIQTADPSKPTRDPVPYTGISFVIIPEYQGIGTTTGQNIAGALAGQTSVDDALQESQDNAVEAMTQAGYIK
ncbi:ABC transporter substrate-binding protein [Agrobacterium rubi]|uniref:Sugar ABC transporter substrate-binding protein n=2 Tax=Agrobacterium TaxID=357 RepID=A0AAE7RAG7_9HYPH|nr:sugar ABC transporter substrate-binding protein [Agrobacterium rosae]NTE90197.1 sugar ABC transporter substrate-binding protein [Agrobacterium rubi]NTF06016.1 sugar ABC transporter substrate-binding protein [Agrobacterium rubi]NTF10564.1 sugar ABC transporter substrate-binding protein [Agrobacterium rubi]NTF22958.1 sugar ABC transporter substrate-binding protein [Agrobacterium rubi]